MDWETQATFGFIGGHHIATHGPSGLGTAFVKIPAAVLVGLVVFILLKSWKCHL
jgi:hypothetical protein